MRRYRLLVIVIMSMFLYVQFAGISELTKSVQAEEPLNIIAAIPVNDRSVMLLFNSELERASILAEGSFSIIGTDIYGVPIKVIHARFHEDINGITNEKTVIVVVDRQLAPKSDFYTIKMSGIKAKNGTAFSGNSIFGGTNSMVSFSFMNASTISSSIVDLKFSFPVNQISAALISSYTLKNSIDHTTIVIVKAERQIDGRKVRLTLDSPLLINVPYTITMSSLYPDISNWAASFNGNSTVQWTGISSEPIPDIPKQVFAEFGDQRVKLSWRLNDQETMSGYRIYEAGNFVTEVPYTQTEYLASGLNGAKLYQYSITSLDQYGRESEPALFNSGTPASGLRLTNVQTRSHNSLLLTFNKKLAGSLANQSTNYLIRDAQFNNVLVEQAELQPNGKSVIVYTAQQTVGTSYYIKAINLQDEAGEAISVYSTELEFIGISPDLMPPKQVSDLQLIESPDQRQLSWTWTGTDQDLAGFRVYAYNELLFELTAEARQASISDFNPLEGERYSVVSFDYSGNESFVVYKDTTDPVPGLFMIERVEAVTNNRVLVTFNQDVDLTAAETKSNYQISEAYNTQSKVEVISAIRGSNHTQVMLTVAGHPKLRTLYKLDTFNMASVNGKEVLNSFGTFNYVYDNLTATISLYIGREGSALQRFIEAQISPQAMDALLSNMTFKIVSADLASTHFYTGRDLFVSQENGRFYWVEDGRIWARYRFGSGMTAGATMQIHADGYMSPAVVTFHNLEEQPAIHLWPGDLAGPSFSQADGAIDLWDYQYWLRMYKNIQKDRQMYETFGLLRLYDFSRDGVVNNIDFSLWQSSSKHYQSF